MTGERALPGQRYQRSCRLFFQAAGTEWTQRGVRPNLTGLPVFLSIATRVEFQINLANFSGKLLGWVSSGAMVYSRNCIIYVNVFL